MRIYNKIISIIISISILVSCCTAVAAKEGEQISNSRDFLKGIGFFEEDLVGDVSLQDAAEMLVKASGNDVVDDPIVQAKMLGLIPQKTQSSVTVSEFAEGLLKILGYGTYLSDDKVSVLDIAKDIGIMAGVYARPGDVLDVDVATEMVKNMLFASPLIMIDSKSFKKSSNTYLHEKLEISIVKGLITANSKTGIFDDNGAEGHIAVDGIAYSCRKDYDKYLGYSVEVFIDSDEEVLYVLPKKNVNEVVSISGEDIFDVSESVINYEKGDSRKKIKYAQSIPYIENSKYKGPLTVAEFEYSSNEYFRDTSYTFIDNNGDDIADLCIANQYKYFKIEDISQDYKYAFDKFNKYFLCFDEKDNFYFASGEKTTATSISPDSIIAIACTEEELTEICTENSDREGYDIYIISEEYGNMVNSFSQVSEGRYEMILGECSYGVNMNYGITPERVSADNLISQTVNIYVDMLGKIISYEITNTDGMAYITQIKINTEDDGYMMRIYTSSGKHEWKNISKRVMVEDPTPTVTAQNINRVCRDYAQLPQSTTVESVLRAFDNTPVSSIRGYDMLEHNIPNLTGQLVRVGYNKSGEVSRIYLPRQLCFGEKGKDNEFNIVTYDVVLDKLNQIAGYETATKLANPQARRNFIMDTYRIGNSPFTYYIPLDLTDRSKFKYLQISTRDASYVNVDSTYTVDLFLSESNGSYETNLEQVEVHNRPCIVTKVKKAIGEDDNIVLKVEVYYENMYKTFTTENLDLRSVNDAAKFGRAALYKDIAAEDLDFGDIIQVNESEGELNSFRLLVDASEDLENNNYMAYNNDTTTYAYYQNDTFTGSKAFFTTSEYRCGLAKVMEFNNVYMRTKVNNSGGKELNFWPASFSFRVLIDVDNKTITPMNTYLMTNGKIRAAFYYFLWGADRIFYMYK